MTRADQGRGVGRGACRVQQGFLEEKNEGMRERDREAEETREEAWSGRFIQLPGKAKSGLQGGPEEEEGGLSP